MPMGAPIPGADVECRYSLFTENRKVPSTGARVPRGVVVVVVERVYLTLQLKKFIQLSLIYNNYSSCTDNKDLIVPSDSSL